jgi:hypothetical protein
MAGATTLIMNGIKGALLGTDPDGSPYKDRVLIGSKALPANLGPPCIILVADGSDKFTTPEGPGQNPQTPVIGSRTVKFTAHCWGCAPDDDPFDVYSQSESLADAVFTAIRYLVGAGNARVLNENWIEAGQGAAGVMLVRSFECRGSGIQEIQLPLTRPIVPVTDAMVTCVLPVGQTAPYDDGGLPATDGSIGVRRYGT